MDFAKGKNIKLKIILSTNSAIMKYILLPLFFTFISALVCAQSFSSILNSSEMYIEGTSTLHDWKSDVEEFSVKCDFNGAEIKDVRFEAQVESIKSGKSGMDKNTFKAMKSKEYPNIVFTAKKLNVNGTSITGEGELTIAGITKKIPVNFTSESWAEDSYNIFGSIKLKMTDFNIDPPRAMMGAIKTGDDITISFSISLVKN